MFNHFQFKNLLALLIASATLFSTTAAHAIEFIDTISFTEAEKANHARKIAPLTAEASACLNFTVNRHREFWETYQISGYYGNRSDFAKLPRQTVVDYLNQRRPGLDANKIVDQLLPTSCVDLAMDCLKKGFEKTGQADLWDRIFRFMIKNEKDANSLQHALQQLGWKVLYWNGDVSQNAAWDAKEEKANPTNSDHFYGEHSYRWKTVSTTKRYYQNYVDDFSSLVNMGTRIPEKFKAVPFWVGTAHTGYHTFPGTYGQAMEAHSIMISTSKRMVEAGPFNPMDDENRGSPRGLTNGRFRSGLIAVPPGYGY